VYEKQKILHLKTTLSSRQDRGYRKFGLGNSV
jgi:hypothetical protein